MAAAEEHRKAVDECAAAILRIDRASWTEAARPGGWSRAEIAEHLAIAYDPPLSELSGGPGFRVRLPWWKRRYLRWKVLPLILRGGFPARAPAPREIRPSSALSEPEPAARRLREQAERFLGRLAASCEAGDVRLTHAYFGKLSARELTTLLTSHVRHHRRQLVADEKSGEAGLAQRVPERPGG